MKTSFLVLVLSTILSVAQAASKVEVVNVPDAPAFMDLERYPVYKAGRTYNPEQVAEITTRHKLGTRKLEKEFSGLMWDGRKLSPTTLPAGTLVLLDWNGTPRYKAACLNRLVAYPTTPCPMTQCPAPASGKESATSGKPGFLDRLSYALKNAALGVWRGLGSLAESLGKLLGTFGWLALLILGLMFLPLLVYLLYRLFRAIRGNGNGGAGTFPPNQGSAARIPPQPPAPPQQAAAGTPATAEEFFEANFVNGEMQVTTRNFKVERIRYQQFPDGTSRLRVTRV